MECISFFRLFRSWPIWRSWGKSFAIHFVINSSLSESPLKTIGANGSWCSIQVVLMLSFWINWLLGNFCVTGVYQATARRGAAALGNPSAAAAPGAGHVTGNTLYLSCSVALGLIFLSLPWALGRAVVITRPFWLVLWTDRLKWRRPLWSCYFGQLFKVASVYLLISC